MLLSKEAERMTYQVASNMTYLELSTKKEEIKRKRRARKKGEK